MPLWDGPQVLKAFKNEAGLEDANELDDAADIYPRCSNGQEALLDMIASIYPDALMSAPLPMTASVDRKTFSYGADPQGNPNVPRGWVQIAPTLNAFTGDTFVGWVKDRDFLDEGDHIRIVGNRSYSGTLYARAVFSPPDISGTQPPALNPITARQLIPIIAVREWALEGNQLPALAQAMNSKIAERFPRLMLVLRQRFRGGGAGYDPNRWWFANPDLGSTGNANS